MSESNSDFTIKHGLKQSFGLRVSLYSWFFFTIGHQNNEVQTTEILIYIYRYILQKYLGNSRGFISLIRTLSRAAYTDLLSIDNSTSESTAFSGQRK